MAIKVISENFLMAVFAWHIRRSLFSKVFLHKDTVEDDIKPRLNAELATSSTVNQNNNRFLSALRDGGVWLS